MRLRISIIVMLLSASSVVAHAHADAIVKTQAMHASTITEIFVDQQGVRIELEIGPADLETFADLLPEEVYARVRDDGTSAADRARRFVQEKLVLRDEEGAALAGVVEESRIRRRIIRDEVTGEPAADQPPDAELVLSVQLKYDFDRRPAQLTIQPPRKPDGESSAASIGFVCYHDGLPVNDFRYLPGSATLHLDWEDPWYSHFQHPNLRRQFDAPLSVFTYVEPYEVRQEVVVRPRDLQQWVDLGLDRQRVIPISNQENLKSRAAEFLLQRNPLIIDGQRVKGRLDRIHFIRQSLRTTGIVDPPEELDAASATLGVIIVYPIEQLPQEVDLQWELFNDRIDMVPAVASDEAGGLPSRLTPDNAVLQWRNYLKDPTSTELTAIPPPPSPDRLTVPLASVGLAIAAAALLLAAVRGNRSPPGRKWQLPTAAIVVFVAWICWPVGRVTLVRPISEGSTLAHDEATQLVGDLLLNVYRSFDHHDESLIYDRLAQTIDGDLLSDVYLQTRQSMEVRNQGGLRISVKEVNVVELDPSESTDNVALSFRCRWRVAGWIGHWGHLHSRQNEHVAQLTIAPRDDRWKFIAMEVQDAQPIESQDRP